MTEESKSKKLRVYKLASEINISAEQLVEFLQKKGHVVKSIQSILTDDMITEINNHFKKDIELIDIKEELGNDIYELLINHRYDTAIEVLSAGPEKLKEIEGLDEEKIAFIIETIKSQFEEEE
jgi:hypothetical protein